MNPYEVLGVSPDADEETIKKVYRDLIKKYHPDRYINNPLADLAAEKTKELNKAYDMIMNKSGGQRQNGTQSSGGGEYYRSAGGNSGFAQPDFAEQNYGGNVSAFGIAEDSGMVLLERSYMYAQGLV